MFAELHLVLHHHYHVSSFYQENKIMFTHVRVEIDVVSSGKTGEREREDTKQGK